MNFIAVTLPAPSAIAVSAIAPHGRLRASINTGNPILAAQGDGADAIGFAAHGVSVDLAVALADWLSLPLDLVVVDSAGKSVANVDEGLADFGFFALDPARAATLKFTSPYVLIAGAYLVRYDSPLQSAAEVDEAGTTVCVGRGSAYDLFLSRQLRRARIERAATSPTVVETLIAQGWDVAAGVRQQLEFDLVRHSGRLRLLPENFMTIEQAMATHRDRGTDVAALLQSFIEVQKDNSFVALALRRHGIEGAVVAPPFQRDR